MAHLIDKSALVAEIERLRRVRPSDSLQPTEENKLDWLAGKAFCIASLKVFLDTLEVKEVDLEKEMDSYFMKMQVHENENIFETSFKDIARHFVNWQKNHLWKPADGDELPIIDREVIALLDNGKVVFAHRPPEYWDGKDIVTGKVTRNYPKTYDKGGWNIPDIKWWLDVKFPK